jgi:hypothetical protein
VQFQATKTHSGMKIIALLIIIAMTSCGNNINVPENSFTNRDSANTNLENHIDTSGWIENFRAFRDAVYRKDKIKMKQFFKFPIMHNEVWYFVEADKKDLPDPETDDVKPFTEKDYDKYYDRFFGELFTKALLKIKTAELAGNHHFETPVLRDEVTEYKLNATVDKETKTLTLFLTANTTEGESGEVYESSTWYNFEIINNRDIKLFQITMAG